MANWLKRHQSDLIMVALFALLCAGLTFVDIAPERPPPDGEKLKARVLEVDNSGVIHQGLLNSGFQFLKVEILEGPRKGQVFSAANQLLSQMDLDKFFSPGDSALVAVRRSDTPERNTILAQSHYRTGWTLALLSLFALLLVAFAGLTGVKALLSFIFSCLVVWKLEVPLCLKGVDPIMLSFVIVAVLTAAIIFIVAGLNRKGVAAFTGGMTGVAASCLMAVIFTGLFRINGATMPYSQALLYSGYSQLNLTAIYIGAVFLAASGAVMDLAMDVAAGMQEVLNANPDIGRKQLVKSGLNIGRSVVGTMTTTLLLAYSGGYLTLMMTFTAEGVGLVDFIHNQYVASELVKTIIGSFGLVLVAPLTAVAGGFILRPAGASGR